MLCLTANEAFLDFWGWLIVGDLENYGLAAVDNVGRIFEASQESWLLNRPKKQKYYNFVQNITYVKNT